MENKVIYTILAFLNLILIFSCNNNNSVSSLSNSPKSTDSISILRPAIKYINKENVQVSIPGYNGVPLPIKVIAGKPKIKAIKEKTTITPGVSYLPQTTDEENTGKVPTLSSKPEIIVIDTNMLKVFTIGKSTVKAPVLVAIQTPSISDSIKNNFSIQNGDTVFQSVSKLYQQPIQHEAMLPRYKVYSFQNLDVEQGLALSNVMSIIEDRHGNLWFGTDGTGVSKYDGKYFTNYTKKEGLSDDIIRSIFEDKDGNLWFGTWKGGVDKYDGKTFTHYTKKEGFCNSIVRDIKEDKSGNLWFATLGSGVFKFDGKILTKYSKEQGLSNDSIFSIFQDKYNNFWFGTWGNGVNKFDGESFTHFTVKDGLNNNIVRTIAEDDRGNLWFGTEGGGACKYDGNRVEAIERGEVTYNDDRHDLTVINGKFVKSFSNYSTKQGFQDNNVYSIIKDKLGNLWFGTNKGVYVFNGKSFLHYTEREGLNSNYIRSMLKDRQGNLWFGTYGGGVCRYFPESFSYYTDQEGLSNNRVWSILEDNNHNLWFGTMEGGVCKYDRNYYSSYTNVQGLIDNSVRSTFQDKHGNLWFGTENGGVSKFDGKYFTNYTEKQGLAKNRVRKIIEDRQGNIWFGTSKGLTKYDGNRVKAIECGETIPETEKSDLHKINGQYVETLISFTRKDGLPEDNIWDILEDNDGSLWISTTGGGLCKFDGKSFISYTEKEGLCSNYVRSLLSDDNGNIWIGTNGGGISIFNGQSFKNFTESNGLCSNYVKSFLKDRSGNIWIGTISGITCISNTALNKNNSFNIEDSNDELQIFNFGQQDGLKGNEFYPNSGLLDSKNRLWFGSSLALNTIDLNTFEFPTTKPHIQLNSIKISDEFIDFHRYKKMAKNPVIRFTDVAAFYNYPINLELPHNLNYLTFNFSSTDWSAPQKIKYQYKLEGLDNDWSKTTFRSFADYRNIPPGKFTFKIRAIGIAGLWSNTFEYKFEVDPPWWQTWWFRLCCAIGIIGIGIGFYYFRLNSLLHQRELLEIKVDKRTHELKEALKELKNAQLHLVQSERLASIGVLSSGLAHEINNPLNFIQGGVAAIETYINRNLGNHIKHLSPLFDMIYTGIKRATGIIINLENFNRKSETNPVNCDIHEIIDNCLVILHNTMRNKIEIQKKFTQEAYILIGNSGDLHQAVLNILLNAEESIADKGIITIFTKVEKQRFEVRISDTGCGISKENLPKITDPFFTTKDPGKGTGFGLSIAYNIIEEHKGTIEFQSEPGKGTTVFINLPIK